MKLNRLKGENIHRHLNYDVPIAPVTLVVGPNGAGKSSLLELARLALNGPTGARYPVLGESPDYDWTVDARFDDGTSAARWMRKGKHEASHRGRGGTLREVQTRIDQHVGRAATWSLQGFLDLTPAKRLAFLESEILTGAGWTVDRAWKELDKVEASRTELETVLTGGVADPPDPDGRTLLVSIVRGLQDVSAEADVAAKRLKAAIDQDEAEAAASTSGPTGATVATWRARIAELDAEAGTLRERRGTLTARTTLRTTLEGQIREARAELTAHESRDWTFEREALVQERDVLTERIRKGREVVDERDAESKAKEALHRAALDAEAACLATRVAAGEHVADVVAFSNAAAGASKAYALLRQALWHNVDCPICHNPTSPAGVPSADERAALLAFGHASDCEGVTEVCRALDAAGGDALAQARSALDDAQKALDGASVQVGAAKRTQARAVEALETAKRLLETLEADRTAKVAQIDALDAARASAGDVSSKLIDKITALEGKLADVGDDSTTDVDELLAAIAVERGEAEAAADRLNDAAGKIAVREARRVDHIAAVERRTKARALIATVQPLVEKLLTDTLGILESPVDRITRAAMGLGFWASVEGGFTFGLIRGTTRIPFDTASRSERAITMAALRCAIAGRLTGWRSLVIDDLENLEALRRSAFVDSMVTEVAEGRLDNFLGASVDDGWTPPLYAHTIRLSR